MVQFANVYAYAGLQFDGLTECVEESLHRPDPAMMNGVTGIISTLVDFWTSVTPRAGEEYSVMELPTPGLKPAAVCYDERMSAPIRFLAVKIGDNRFSDYGLWVYGWVDDVRVKIQKGQNQSIVIRWHPDWFLTLGNTVTYGAGRVLRGPASLARPDPTEPRMWVDSGTHISLGDSDYWFMILYTGKHTVGGKTYTIYRVAYWQPGKTIEFGPGEYISTIGLQEVYYGELEEIMEIDPNSIQGVWISPIKPVTTDLPQTNTNRTASWYEGLSDDVNVKDQTLLLSGTYSTSDDEKWVLMDAAENSMGVIPWGMKFDTARLMVDFGPSGAYLIMSFRDSSMTAKGYGEGRVFSVPLPLVPVTENAMQSYVYSGEREYDKRLREIQKDQAAINGIAGIGTSAIGGAVAGSMAAGPAGTAAGAVAGVVSSTLGTGLSYLSAGHFDRKTQEAIDKLKSNQAAGSVISAGGLSWNVSMIAATSSDVLRWSLVKLVRDTASAAELTAEQGELGYPTDSYMTSCASLITDARTNGGGLKIEGLEILGANVNAVKYISSLFARGLHIDADPL